MGGVQVKGVPLQIDLLLADFGQLKGLGKLVDSDIPFTPTDESVSEGQTLDALDVLTVLEDEVDSGHNLERRRQHQQNVPAQLVYSIYQHSRTEGLNADHVHHKVGHLLYQR